MTGYIIHYKTLRCEQSYKKVKYFKQVIVKGREEKECWVKEQF